MWDSSKIMGEEFSILQQRLSESYNNFRSFMDIRFKHFTTYIAINTLLFGALFYKSIPVSYDMFIQLLGVIVSILFWSIDERTYQYMRTEIARIDEIQRYLAIRINSLALMKESIRPRPKFISASLATRLLFLVFIVTWIVLIIEDARIQYHARATLSLHG